MAHWMPPLSLSVAFLIYSISAEELAAWCHAVENLSRREPPRLWAFVSIPAGLGGLGMYILVALAAFHIGVIPALALLGVGLLAVALDAVVFDVAFKRKRYWTRPVFLALFYGDLAYMFHKFVAGAGLYPVLGAHWV